MKFDGATYDPTQDGPRLNTAMARVYDLCKDGKWRTLKEIASAVGCSESGASARIRDLRKPKFAAQFPSGGVERRRVEGGLWEYKVCPPVKAEKKQAVLFVG